LDGNVQMRMHARLKQYIGRFLFIGVTWTDLGRRVITWQVCHTTNPVVLVLIILESSAFPLVCISKVY
jgi:hypothetical protein